MIIVYYSGGLGNQMFQYAFSKSLIANNHVVFANTNYYRHFDCHNGFELPQIFNLIIPVHNFPVISNYLPYVYKLEQVFSSMLGHKVIYEKKRDFFSYNEKFLNASYNNKTVRFIGYWQSENYFSGIKNQIENEFSFNKDRLTSKNIETLQRIANLNTVSVHVRRGDYIGKKASKLHGDVCSPKYYANAINYFNRRFDKVWFLFFSNDITWCRENFELKNATFVDWNTKENSWMDMCLMTNCNHNIIANSSFSWWGAWLNKNKNKIVIAPDVWHHSFRGQDVWPSSWIRMAH